MRRLRGCGTAPDHLGESVLSDSRPIGLFDSGIGGLTVLKSLMKALPNEDYLYVGDTARTPYGQKSVESVAKYARQITRFLVQQNVKAIVVACNTVSAVALDAVCETAGEIPVFGVIAPLVEDAILYATAHHPLKIGVLATMRTVRSEEYPTAMLQGFAGDDLEVSQIASPIFVSLVEEGIWQGEFAEAGVRHYLAPWIASPPELILLACTHYPLLKPLIARYLPDAVIYESGPALVRVLNAYLVKHDMVSAATKEGKRKFFCTDTIDSFKEPAAIFLGREIDDIAHLDWKLLHEN